MSWKLFAIVAVTLSVMTLAGCNKTASKTEPVVNEPASAPATKAEVDSLCRGCPTVKEEEALPEICEQAKPYVGEWRAVTAGDQVVVNAEYTAKLSLYRNGKFKIVASNSLSDKVEKHLGTWVYDYQLKAVELAFQDGEVEYVKQTVYNPLKLDTTIDWAGPIEFFKLGDSTN